MTQSVSDDLEHMTEMPTMAEQMLSFTVGRDRGGMRGGGRG